MSFNSEMSKHYKSTTIDNSDSQYSSRLKLKISVLHDLICCYSLASFHETPKNGSYR